MIQIGSGLTKRRSDEHHTAVPGQLHLLLINPSSRGRVYQALGALPLPTDTLSAAEVLSFRDRAFHVFFEHPRYLAHIKKQYGENTVEHIK